MLLKTLAAGAALSMLVVGGSAVAQTRASAMASPKQPIPYERLNAYMKASPKARATTDWWNGSAAASTGASVDTSTSAPMGTGTMSGDAKASASVDTSVNPAPTAPPASLPETPPTLPPAATTPDPGSNLPAPQIPPVPK